MHIRQISLASVGFIISIFLIFSGFTFSASRVAYVDFGPPVAHAGEIVSVILTAVVVAVIVVTAPELLAGAADFLGTAGGDILFGAINVGSAELATAISIVSWSSTACTAGLICGNDGGSDNGTYNVAAGTAVGGKCYGPLNSCGKGYEGTYESDPATGQMGCKIGGSFTYGAPADSTCSGPSIDYFRIKNDDPGPGAGTVDSGQSVTLEWSSPGASYCKWAGAEKNYKVDASGSVDVGPLTQTSTYKINCADTSDNYGFSKFVTVTVLEPDVTITANHLRVRAGDTAVITWSGKDILSCTVSDLAGKTLASGEGEKHVFSTGSPYSTEIMTQSLFRIACQTNGDPITKSVMINVVPNYEEF